MILCSKDLDCMARGVIEMEETYMVKDIFNFNCALNGNIPDRCYINTVPPRSCNNRRQCSFPVIKPDSCDQLS